MGFLDNIWGGLEEYLQEHATPDMTTEELNALTQQYMAEYNALPEEERIRRLRGLDREDATSYVRKSDNASSKTEKLRYLKKALELDPDHIEAQMDMAMYSSDIPEEQVSAMEEVVKKSTALMERKGLLPDHAGHFWGILETRPYMQLLNEYTQLLISIGCNGKAIQVMEEMLRLCPDDNLGIRYLLMAEYAAMEDSDSAFQLYNTYRKTGGWDEDEIMKDSQMLLPLIALYYKRGELDEAARYLKALNSTNKDTLQFFRMAQNPQSMNVGYSSFGIVADSIQELVYAYHHAPFLYLLMPCFAQWGLRVLKGTDPDTASSPAPRKGGIRTVKKSRKRKK